MFLFVSKLQPFCNDFRLKSCYHPYRRRLCGKHRKGEFHTKKHLQCGLTAALTLALLLTACGQKEADANDTPPDAQAGSLYEDFFTGDVTVTANLINTGVEATTASFRAPDVYATKGVDGSDMDWTITRFALLDLDGDGADELVLNIDFSGEEEYVILTCYDGAVYANQVVYRGFCHQRPTARSNGRTVPSTTAHPAPALKMACWSMTILLPCPKAVMEMLFTR